MRAKEFITERRQVNEFFPALAAVPYLGAAASSIASMSAVTLVLQAANLALGIYQAHGLYSDYQDKAEAFGTWVPDWPEDEKEKIYDGLISAGLGALLGAAGVAVLGRGVKYVMGKIPKEVKQEAMEKIAPKIEVELKKVIKKDAPSPGTKVTPATGTKVTPATGTKSTATPADIEKDRARIMGTDKPTTPTDPKQAELKKRLSGQPETPQEKLKRELLAKQAAK